MVVFCWSQCPRSSFALAGRQLGQAGTPYGGGRHIAHSALTYIGARTRTGEAPCYAPADGVTAIDADGSMPASRSFDSRHLLCFLICGLIDDMAESPASLHPLFPRLGSPDRSNELPRVWTVAGDRVGFIYRMFSAEATKGLNCKRNIEVLKIWNKK